MNCGPEPNNCGPKTQVPDSNTITFLLLVLQNMVEDLKSNHINSGVSISYKLKYDSHRHTVPMHGRTARGSETLHVP
jgi:hypothetical protein